MSGVFVRFPRPMEPSHQSSLVCISRQTLGPTQAMLTWENKSWPDAGNLLPYLREAVRLIMEIVLLSTVAPS